MASARKLLVVDLSYAWEAIRARGLEQSVTCRDLDGFFDHVWTVHPFASLVEERTNKLGAPEYHTLSPVHTFINGKIGRFESLRRFAPVNFAIGQAAIFADLLSLIRRENVSAIRGSDPYSGLMGLGLARLSGIPLVMRVGANYDEVYALTGKTMMPRLFPWRALEKAIVRIIFSNADLVAAVNDDNLRFAIANGARAESSTIFRYGNLIDKRHIAPPEERRKDTSVLEELWGAPRRFLLNINRLEKLKLPDEVLRVHAEVRRRGHDVELVMVGDGSMRTSLEDLARELGTADHVFFAGNREQGWLARLIPLAAAVVSPCTGRALTEVSFGAAPVAGYDMDWQKELITPGVTGELVAAHDWMGLSDAVARLLDDPARARRMGDAVRKRAFEMLDPDVLNQHERDKYAELLRRFAR